MNKQIGCFALLAIAGSSLLSSCSKEKDLYDSNLAQKEFEQSWTETYGEVAADQDWNLATRATANVNLEGTYDVKIYSANPINPNSRLMASYTVNGSTSFKFDAPKGLTSVYVTAENSDGYVVNSYVSLSNGVVNVSNTTRAALTRAESCSVTSGTAIVLSTSARYNFVKETKTLIEATIIPLIGNTCDKTEKWTISDILPIVGLKGVFSESASNKTTYIPSKLTKDVSFKATGKPIEVSFVYGGTARYNKIAYFYWKDGATEEEILASPKYLLIDDARPNKNVFLNEADKEVDGGMSWPTYISNAYYGNINGDDHDMVHSKYKLVYFDENSTASYEFPENLNVGFMLIAGASDNTTYNFNNEDFANNKFNLYSSITSQNDYYGMKERVATSVSTEAIAAVTYRYGNTTFLGFEDQADQDLNDILFTIDGIEKSSIPDLNPTTPKSQSWIVACEDLGSSDDTDFNDVVFEVSHVAGENTATVKPLAAGGTLKAEIFSGETLIGEIHEMLDNNTTDADGNYSMLNTSTQKNGYYVVDVNNLPYSASTREETLGVNPSEFTMSNVAGGTSMGGFKIKVTKKGTSQDAITIAAPPTGSVPQMLCIPNTDWAWPTERTHIETAYPQFKEWVGDTSYKEWYKHPASTSSAE